METYFITGATGFLGGRLVETLLREKSARVLAFGRNPTAGKKLSQAGATFIQGDLSEVELLENSIPENAIVIHCAALSSAWGKYQDFYDANVRGTENILRAALKNHAKRFIHISTPSIYIEPKSKNGIKESEPIPQHKINHYAQTKWLAEQLVDRAFAAGLPVITLRPQGIIGPGDTAIFPRLLRVAKKGFVPVIGDEKVTIDLTHVDNVVEAIRLAVTAPTAALGKKFNITNGEPVEQLKMMKWLFSSLGYPVREKKLSHRKAMNIAGVLEGAYRLLPLKGEPLLTRYSVCALGYTRTLDIEEAKTVLGYRPIVPLQKGLEETVAWFQKYNS